MTTLSSIPNLVVGGVGGGVVEDPLEDLEERCLEEECDHPSVKGASVEHLYDGMVRACGILAVHGEQDCAGANHLWVGEPGNRLGANVVVYK